jgi:hypothetical protein
MTRYVLGVYQPEGEPPPPEVLGPIMAELDALTEEMREAGAWVFHSGLYPPSAATVVRASGDEVLLTDGPFAEGKEYLGGFTVVDAPDLDGALGWARRMTEITGLPIEVRPCRW